MDLLKAREQARAYLAETNKAQLARDTGISSSWITKFQAGLIPNPGINRIDLILRHRDGNKLSACADGSATA
jgi:transcriptional regulator with XRE-family HTH domain